MHIPLLVDILIIMGFSVVVVLFLHRLKLPSILGFLITGIIIGPYGLSLVRAIQEVETIAEIGVIGRISSYITVSDGNAVVLHVHLRDKTGPLDREIIGILICIIIRDLDRSCTEAVSTRIKGDLKSRTPCRADRPCRSG